MIPAYFPEANATDQWNGKPVHSLAESFVNDKELHQWSITSWRLTFWERLRLLFTGRVWALRTDRLTVLTLDKEDLINKNHRDAKSTD